MSFVKLDTGILDSSLWVEAAEVRIIFITMLAMADATGKVAATAPGIARRANLPLGMVRDALKLGDPDPDSRSSAFEGRRVLRVEGGYSIASYGVYREKDHTVAERKRRQRERERLSRRDIVTSRRDIVTVTHADADADVDVDEGRVVKKSTPVAAPPPQQASPVATPLPRASLEQQDGGGKKNTHRAANDVADRFIASFNAALNRKCRTSPGIEKAIKARLGAGYEAWLLVALPVLVAANEMDYSYRATIQPAWLLRDGKHPITTGGGTSAATDWAERELNRLDQTKLTFKLADVARKHGVYDELLASGVHMPGGDG